MRQSPRLGAVAHAHAAHFCGMLLGKGVISTTSRSSGLVQVCLRGWRVRGPPVVRHAVILLCLPLEIILVVAWILSGREPHRWPAVGSGGVSYTLLSKSVLDRTGSFPRVGGL